MNALAWGSFDVNGTSLRGYLDNTPYRFDELVARLRTLSGQDPTQEDADKVSVEFTGRFNGAVFTLYDYKGDMALHIGGRRNVDVDALKTHLAELLSHVQPTPYAARVPREYGGQEHGWGYGA